MQREVIHVSLGSSANAISAHDLNLKGLAATSADNGQQQERILCSPKVTHSIHNDVYVPRALMVDEPYYTTPIEDDANHANNIATNIRLGGNPSNAGIIATWNGPVEEYAMDRSSRVQDATMAHQLSSLFNMASTLAYSPCSRYRAPRQQPSAGTDVYSTGHGGRHVVWDDEGEEEEEEEDDDDDDDDDDDEKEKEKVAIRRKQQWMDQETQLEQQLSSVWSSTKNDEFFDTVSWRDFWMPPHHPKGILSLPLSRESNLIETWDTFQAGNGNALSVWKEEELLERLRLMLEECDSCQGIFLCTEGCGVYAGLATTLLHEMQQECRSAGRMAVHVTDPFEASTTNTSKHNDDPSSLSWQPTQVQRVRQFAQNALTLHGLASNANVLLPISITNNSSTNSRYSSRLSKTAYAAMALEAATLPFRLIGTSNRSYMASTNTYYYNHCIDGVISRLSFVEYLNSIQPTARHCIAELDALGFHVRHNYTDNLWTTLQAGTSVERDRRIRHGGRDAVLRRPRDELPGAWMLDSSLHEKGILSSLSPGSGDRSLHHHFSLSASCRIASVPSPEAFSTCLLEGMGIPYRPERSFCTVVRQTARQLTTERGHGAGSYWKTLWKEHQDPPVLAILGNTTRMYPHLDKVSTELKQVLGQKYRGYFSRDALSGVLPEREDCDEALEYCMDLRDVYHPPESAEDNSYFGE